MLNLYLYAEFSASSLQSSVSHDPSEIILICDPGAQNQSYRDSSPKNENSVIIYSPSSSSKPVWMCLFCRTQRKIFWRKFVTRLFWGTIDFHSRKKNTMEVNGAPELLCFPHSSEYLPLCSAEQTHSYRFGTTWGWGNDDRIFIFGWTIPLSRWGIFVAIAKNTLYGSKLLISLLCQKSLGY